MDLSYGARLRLQREQAGVSLSAIAEQTKIKQSLLDGLERGDLAAWPSGIFRRSYFRAYARAIGLDADAAVREFLERYPDPLEEFGAAEPEVRAGETSRWPTTRLRYLIDSAVSALPVRRPAAPVKAGRLADPALHEDAVPLPDEHAAVVRSPGTPEPMRAGRTDEPAARETGAGRRDDPRITSRDRMAPSPAVRARIDWPVLAQLCTRLSSAHDAHEVTPVLADAARALDAVGVILWVWDARTNVLTASLAHGYPDDMLRQLPRVPADADNAIATAFLSTEAGTVPGDGAATGAVVVPLLTPGGCAGVLALELQPGAERQADVRAAATIIGAQLAALMGAPALPQAQAATA